MATFHFEPGAGVIRLSATVRNGSVQTIQMVFDTGSSSTVIARELALDLGLDPQSTPTVPVVTASDVDHVHVLTIANLEAYGHSIRDLEVLCMNLPPALHAEGLLGMNFLRHFKLFINFPKGVLVVQERRPRHFFHRLGQLLEVVKAHW